MLNRNVLFVVLLLLASNLFGYYNNPPRTPTFIPYRAPVVIPNNSTQYKASTMTEAESKVVVICLGLMLFTVMCIFIVCILLMIND